MPRKETSCSETSESCAELARLLPLYPLIKEKHVQGGLSLRTFTRAQNLTV